jgi:hypothetical protein
VKWSARLGLAGAGFAAALVVAIAATGFLGTAAFLGLEVEGMSPPAAAAVVGVGGLVLAVLLGLVGRHFLSPSQAPQAAKSSGGAVNDAAADLGALVAEQVVSATRKHPYTSIGAALIAGLAVGAVPELRKTLTDLLKR